MTPHYTDPLVTLYLGDCLEVMPELEADSVDSIVTDPPYGLGFMGKHWDHGVPGVDFWREMYRVLKPGGYLLSFAGTRTVHRFGVAIEDAGFEIRDTLMWIYASGFPKSLDVSKALDKVAGEVRDLPRHEGWTPVPGGATNICDTCGRSKGGAPGNCHCDKNGTPATDLARKWEGWGTALKPAHEPIVMARKPLVGTVAANVTRYGTGALNIDGTRIGTTGGGTHCSDFPEPCSGHTGHGRYSPTVHVQSEAGGRWPSNVLISDPELFDVANPYVVGSGAVSTSGDAHVLRRGASTGAGMGYGSSAAGDVLDATYGDSGGYSRFFLIPKADRAERERGLAGKDARRVYGAGKGVKTRQCRQCGSRTNPPGPEPKVWPACGHNDWEWVDLLPIARANVHPTVKPIDLMRHLVRLVTPSGGVTLDPFLGSGTTALAASEEGFRCIGIEREEEYLEIAVGRLMATPMGLGLDTEITSTRAPARGHWPKDRPAGKDGWGFSGQLDLEERTA